ncbi:MAG: MFS transporter [Dehalococcoidia bacterium]|nr:MFS transporter [Dehalococcoidia bacterium]
MGIETANGEPEAIGIHPPKAGGMFSALQYRDFRLFISGMFFANSGMHIRQVAQGWLVYDLTHDAFLLGLVGAVTALPILVLSPLSGVIVDRVNRKKLLMVTQSIGMTAMVVLASLILTKRVEVWHIFAFSLVYGTMQSLYSPARQAFVTQLVDRENLMNAIALSSATNQVSRIIAPAIAGNLIVFVGLAGCFYFAGLTYAAIIIPLLLISVSSMPAGDSSATIWQNFKEGLSYIAGNRTMFALVAMEAIPAIFGWQYQTLLPIFAQDILNVGAAGLGLLGSAVGVGALIGSLSLAALGNYQRKGALLLVAAIVFGISLILFALSPWFQSSLIILIFVGFSSSMYAAMTNTLIQVIVPDELRGRMMGFYMLALNGMMPLGSFQAGVLASNLGAPATLAIGGTIVVIFSIGVMIFVPRLRQL